MWLVDSNVSPASGAAGTLVPIAGSGFGASQGNGQVWLAPANGVLRSWSDTLVVAAVAGGRTEKGFQGRLVNAALESALCCSTR